MTTSDQQFHFIMAGLVGLGLVLLIKAFSTDTPPPMPAAYDVSTLNLEVRAYELSLRRADGCRLVAPASAVCDALQRDADDIASSYNQQVLRVEEALFTHRGLPLHITPGELP